MGPVHSLQLWGARHRPLVVAAIVAMVGLVLITPFALWLNAGHAQPSSKPSYYQRTHDTIEHYLQGSKGTINTSNAPVKVGAAQANGASTHNLGPLSGDDSGLTPDQFTTVSAPLPAGISRPPTSQMGRSKPTQWPAPATVLLGRSSAQIRSTTATTSPSRSQVACWRSASIPRILTSCTSVRPRAASGRPPTAAQLAAAHRFRTLTGDQQHCHRR